MDECKECGFRNPDVYAMELEAKVADRDELLRDARAVIERQRDERKRLRRALEHVAYYGLDDCAKASTDMRAVAKAALEGK